MDSTWENRKIQLLENMLFDFVSFSKDGSKIFIGKTFYNSREKKDITYYWHIENIYESENELRRIWNIFYSRIEPERHKQERREARMMMWFVYALMTGKAL